MYMQSKPAKCCQLQNESRALPTWELNGSSGNGPPIEIHTNNDRKASANLKVCRRRPGSGSRTAMNPSTNHLPGRVPIWASGKEPLPPGLTEEDRPYYDQTKRWQGYTTMAMESCAVKTTLAGGAGTFFLVFFFLVFGLKRPKEKLEIDKYNFF